MPFSFNTISEAEILRSPGGNTMMDAINYPGTKHLIITGCPGSGKTTITIMRAARLHREKKRVLLITYQNMLKISLTNIADPTLRKSISGFYEWYVRTADQYLYPGDTPEQMIENLKKRIDEFDEILIDEGQDFDQRIFETLGKMGKKLCIGADTAQKLHEHGMDSNEIIDLVENDFGEVARYNLLYNYRNNFETYSFAVNFVPDMLRAANPIAMKNLPKGTGTRPIVFQASDHAETLNILRTRLAEAGEVNVAVLLYHQDDVEYYHQVIPTLGDFKCSKYYNEMTKAEKAFTENNLQNILVTTYKSAKGLEFQVVIMPGMESAMDEDYKTEEHYYVGSTRAKENLFLIFEGEKPGYLNTFDDTSFTYRPSNGEEFEEDLPF